MNDSARRTEKEHTGEDATRLDTAYVLLETVPPIMGFVSSELRRHSPIENSVHFRLLRILRRSRRNLHELADQQGVRLPTMSRTVSVLESRGWVKRIRSEEDRRTVFAAITGAGEAVLQEVEELAARRAAELLACLPADELQNLRSGLATLHEVVREQLGSNAEEGAMDSSAPGCREEE
jgi:DNA-binding MarR family transcriptional regulator